MYNKYGEIALKAYLMIVNENKKPGEAWDIVSKEIFVNKEASQKKGCPKDVFLSLCQEGHLINVPKDYYTKSIKNKKYALKIVELLKNNHSINNISTIWEQVNTGTTHNSQIDVVLALFKNNFIN